MENAVNSSDLIIVGKVKEVTKNQTIVVGQSTGLSHNYTISEVEILEVIYGEAKIGDTILVKQMENEEATKAAGYLEVNQLSILLLVTFDATPASLINPSQGKMVFEDNLLTIQPVDDLYKMLNNQDENQEQTSSNIKDTSPITYDYETVIEIIEDVTMNLN